MNSSKRSKTVFFLIIFIILLTVLSLNNNQSKADELSEFEDKITSYDNDYTLIDDTNESSGLLFVAQTGEKIISKIIDVVMSLLNSIIKKIALTRIGKKSYLKDFISFSFML